MFTGAIPVKVLTQLVHSTDFGAWGRLHVCCSGSFRFDRATKMRWPDLKVHGNDISLISCAIGALVTNRAFPIKFHDRLDWLEELVKPDFRDRVAALMVILAMGRYLGKSAYARRMFAHYQEHWPDFHASAMKKLGDLTEGFTLDGFYAGDFRDHAKAAVEAGAGIAGFMPTYKGGYERLYKFLDAGATWEAPQYRVWDPKDLPDWLNELKKSGVPYAVVTDHEMPGHVPTTEFRSAINKPVYGHVGGGKSSYRRSLNREASFKYERVDPAALTPTTTVQFVPATSAQMNFLKNNYLAKGIAHATGMMNWLVLLDGKLAGGFIYTRDKLASPNVIYLLSDFCIVHEGRLAKLVAMLASAQEPVREWNRRNVVKVQLLCTTAFTKRPVSMKYRGIYDLKSRKESWINYERKITGRTAADLYTEWYGRFFLGAKNADRAGAAQGAEAPDQERALPAGTGVQPPRGKHRAGRVPDKPAARLPR